MARLTPKQRAFISEYFLCGLNATEAAIRAGYRVKDRTVAGAIGFENLKKPHIAAEIERRLAKHAMSADEVLFRLSDMARGTIDDVLDDSGKPSVEQIRDRGKTHLIKKFEYEEVVTEKNTFIRYKVELHDAQSALVQLGRYHKLFTDKIEIHTWEDDAILAIQRREMYFEQLAEAIGESEARRLYGEAGVPIPELVDESENREG